MGSERDAENSLDGWEMDMKGTGHEGGGERNVGFWDKRRRFGGRLKWLFVALEVGIKKR